MLNQAVGPPLFRAAIVAMGEQHNKSRGLPSVAAAGASVAAAPPLEAGGAQDEEHTG